MQEKEAEPKKRITIKGLKNAFTVFQFMKPYRWNFAIGFFFLVIASFLFMGIPVLIGEMLKAAEGASDYPFTVNHYALGLFGIILLQGFFSFMRVNLFAIVSEKGMADLRKMMYQKLLSQPLEFFETRRTGEITSRITADVEQLQTVFSFTFAELIRQVIILVVGIVVLILLQPTLSLIMLGTLPIIVIFAMLFGRYIKKLSRVRQDNLAATNVVVEETLQSFSAVKTFVNEHFELKRYSQSIADMVSIALKFARAKGWFISFIIVFLFGIIIAVVWQGALQIQAGNMKSGDLVTFVMFTMIIGGTIAGFGNNYTLIAGALGATERVKEILDEDEELDLIGASAVDALQLKQQIRFSDVSFRYPTRPDVEVLKQISFEVKKGDKVALVGSSGSGKSTIVKLLSALYPLEKGNISIDGANLVDIELAALRKSIGVVPQEVILFGGTIEENIAYGNPDASAEEIVAAAKKANALPFIEKFPEGMQTLVGERGVQLSGGQKQRVAIARAILKDPQILVLDEATSSLDAESERLVQDALEKLMENRTTFIIAHRLSTVRNADTIFAVHEGRIVEEGNHETLLQNPEGFYANLLKLQLSAED